MRGTVQSVAIISGGGFSETGSPIADVSGPGIQVECLYFANVYNNRGTFNDDVFKRTTYNITTKDMSFSATEIILRDKKGDIVCKKQVQTIEVLDAVRRVKITV